MAERSGDDASAEARVEECPGATPAEAVRAEARDIDAVLGQDRPGDADELAQGHGGAQVGRGRQALVLPLAQQWEAVNRDALRVERGREGAYLQGPRRHLPGAVTELLFGEAGHERCGHSPECIGRQVQESAKAGASALEGGLEPR